MDGRMKKYRQVSPERAKVWTEKSPIYRYNHHYNQQQKQKQQHTRKVPVVYYLCRNRQLEHPHFMEVPLSSSDDLYLRDVIERLNVLRGRGIASMYSWSCKRSYKNGYVWHDLSEDDVVHPAHGNEYILKGSELFEETINPGRFSPAGNFIVQTQKALPEPPSSRNQDESSSSSSLNGRTTKSSQDDELSPALQRPCLSAVSPEYIVGKNSSWNGSLSLTENKVYKSDGLADASTQTEEKASGVDESRHTCIRGHVSTDDGLLESHQSQVSEVEQNQEICRDFVSPLPSKADASSLSGRTDTLESLIRADVRKLNRFRILEEEGFGIPSSTKLKVTNAIMQLISCGSISVKDHNYRLRFPNSKFPSLLSTSLMLGETDCLAENPRPLVMRLKDRECFSGSLAERSMLKEDASTLKRFSSSIADRSTQLLDSIEDKEEGSPTSSKCILKSIKASLSKQPICELLRSPLSEGRRISSERVERLRTIKSDTSDGGSKRVTQPLSGEKEARKPESPRNDKENVIKIEESLLQEPGL